jgi:ribosomal protein S12 methylthiotransferase
MDKKTFSIVTLGCFRNTYDSSVISGKYQGQGFKFLPDFLSSLENKKSYQKNCQWLIINTCGFIEAAKKESLSAIEAAIDLKSCKAVEKIAVCGCLVKRYRKELEKAYPQVDLWKEVVQNKDIDPSSSYQSPNPAAFLKIAEGCFNNCSYCAIPLIKGTLSSRPAKDILKEAMLLDEARVKELNIIGQDITSWGKDLNSDKTLTTLLKKLLDNTKNIPWMRLLYAHPRHLDDSLIDLIAREKRICKYIDLPIQHANDRILRAMNRKFSKKRLKDLICKIRDKIPNCILRTSVIVGFPGETDKEFKELIEFLSDIKFERLGVFCYSREENTAANSFSNHVHHKTKIRRAGEIMNLQKSISQAFNQTLIGKTLDILIESKEQGSFYGRTQYDALEVDGVVFVKKSGLKIGDIYKGKIVDALEYDLVAV